MRTRTLAVAAATIAVLFASAAVFAAAAESHDSHGSTPASAAELDESASLEATYSMHSLLTTDKTPNDLPCQLLKYDGKYRAVVCFKRHGDEFWMIDERSDGYYIRMRGQLHGTETYLQCYTTRTGVIYQAQKCLGNTWSSWIPEPHSIRFRAEIWKKIDGQYRPVHINPWTSWLLT